MSASQLLQELDAASGVLVRPSKGYPWVWYSRRSGAHLRASNPEMQIIDLALIVAAIQAAEKESEPLMDATFRARVMRLELSWNEIADFVDALESSQMRLRLALAGLTSALAKETTE